MLLSKNQLVDKVVAALAADDWHVSRTSAAGAHPVRLQIGRGTQSLRAKVNIWNLTHGGGGARPADEYRVQITSDHSFSIEEGCVTAILGWWEPVGVFAAFDPTRHQGDLGHSPSIQIREGALRAAHENRFATHRKANEEIAVAFKPDMVAYYLLRQAEIHGFADSETDRKVLEAVASEPEATPPEAVDRVSGDRQRVVAEVYRLLRDHSFRDRVLSAYSSTCAVCGLQLGLVEAAHIIPAAFENSSDETCNGMAFCPTHHRAYDRALITIDPEYRVVLSESRCAELTEADLAGGADGFRERLRAAIVLPPEHTLRPRPEFLQAGSVLRGWVP